MNSEKNYSQLVAVLLEDRALATPAYADFTVSRMRTASSPHAP
ncbi:MAG: hypothetical protein BWX84_02784 [Verrucomicrobia bacterium ADurb.Bin118]|jgi:hypothetical protein|nr:MAG: hypothetical protein BWX84_02784 [Verrucomicrobia bacterium ADurb.Bin118]